LSLPEVLQCDADLLEPPLGQLRLALGPDGASNIFSDATANSSGDGERVRQVAGGHMLRLPERSSFVISGPTMEAPVVGPSPQSGQPKSWARSWSLQLTADEVP
jgi:hypothetical protein